MVSVPGRAVAAKGNHGGARRVPLSNVSSSSRTATGSLRPRIRRWRVLVQLVVLVEGVDVNSVMEACIDVHLLVVAIPHCTGTVLASASTCKRRPRVVSGVKTEELVVPGSAGKAVHNIHDVIPVVPDAGRKELCFWGGASGSDLSPRNCRSTLRQHGKNHDQE